MKTKSNITSKNLNRSLRTGINPIRSLTPQSLTRNLDAFHQGYLAPAVLLWDSIEARDDVLKGVICKRKKALAHLPWEILTLDNSPEALHHQQALQFFYNNLSTTHATDENQRGAFSLLIKQMSDSIGKKYAVHEIVFHKQPSPHQLTAEFRFVPLQFFENTSGALKFLDKPDTHVGQPLDPDSWLVTVGDGLMEASSIAYLFKHLPLRDWLIYCERNGMPGVKGITDARPGTPQWNAAREAVLNFGAEFHALMTRGTDIQAIDLTSRGELPYPLLVERMDRAMISLWRGSDLSTLSRDASGASLQFQESQLILQDDAQLISETLNAQVDRVVLKHLFNVDHGKAYIKIHAHDAQNINQELEYYQKLKALGVPIPLNHIQERFGIPQPKNNELCLTNNS